MTLLHLLYANVLRVVLLSMNDNTRNRAFASCDFTRPVKKMFNISNEKIAIQITLLKHNFTINLPLVNVNWQNTKRRIV